MDVFTLWYWRRLLRVSWTSRRSNQSILKEISSACSLEGMMLKLKLQYFGHLMRRVDSLEKTLMLGWIGGRRRRGQQKGTTSNRWWMASPTRCMWVWVNSGSWWWTGRPGVLQFMWWQRVGHDWATELNGTDLGHWMVAHHATLSRFILQARILEWAAMPSSTGSSWPGDQTRVSYFFCIDKWVLYY